MSDNIDDSTDEDMFTQFLKSRGHTVEEGWDKSYNKFQCPECGSIHSEKREKCTTCDWMPK